MILPKNYLQLLVITEMPSQNSGLSTGSDNTLEDYGLKRVLSDYVEEPDPKRSRTNIMTPGVVAALDRANVSSRKATYIVSAVLSAVKMDVQDFNISSSSIQRHRIAVRREIFADLKENLQVAKHLVVHWDGKMLPAITGIEKVDRLAILITGCATEQLLAVPELDSSSGQRQAEAVIDTLREWNVTDRVKALCFDTTSSNTGNLIEYSNNSVAKW